MNVDVMNVAHVLYESRVGTVPHIDHRVGTVDLAPIQFKEVAL